MIREKLTLELNQEVPYGIAVEVERLAEEDGQLEVDAAIWVDREGQKPIVIGAGGERLKRVGRAARLALNGLLGRRLHLKLWVKVRENWADNARALQAAGSRMSRSPHRVQLAPGYLLHHRPCRDTSRILEVFAREHGRLTLFARAVRGPHARLAPVLQPFQPLLLSWSGRGEAPQLTGAERAEACAPLPPRLPAGRAST